MSGGQSEVGGQRPEHPGAGQVHRPPPEGDGHPPLRHADPRAQVPARIHLFLPLITGSCRILTPGYE